MHLIVHIFKKDIHRLWWGIAVALLLLGWMAFLDARGETADLPDFSLLLMVTWTCLIALAVQDDPLVGDRQFWITRPSRWPVLLGSKLLFAVALVHIPVFLADIMILAARGFHPWAWLGSLLTKQLALAVGITLPAIALAAIMQSFVHLALTLIAIGGLTAFITTFTPLLHSRWRGMEDARVMMFFAVFAVAAAVMVPLQFARRRTWKSRSVGVAAVLAAELLYISLSPAFIAGVRAALDPTHTTLAFHLRPAPTGPGFDGPGGRYPAEGWTTVRLPLSLTGVPDGLGSLYDPQTLELIADGNREDTLHPSYIGPDWLIVDVRKPLYESLKDARVELKGTVAVVLHRVAPSTSIEVGANLPVAGVGRCSSEIVDLTGMFAAAGARAPTRPLRTVNVDCESPAGFPLEPFARLWQPAETGAPPEQLGAPSNPWLFSLSPVRRAYGSFRAAQAPSALAGARLEIIPDIPQGWQVVTIDLRDIRLGDYALLN
jgi:hypothetical protein